MSSEPLRTRPHQYCFGYFTPVLHYKYCFSYKYKYIAHFQNIKKLHQVKIHGCLFYFFLNNMTRTATPDTQSFAVPSKVYFSLITMELVSIGIKYQGSNTNPFQQSSPTMMLLLSATTCHAIAQTAKINFPTIIVFHVSGVIACETLLWILLAEIWKCLIINVLLSLVAAFCFYYNHICQLLTKLQGTCFTCILLLIKSCSRCREKGSNANQMTDLEGLECIGAQMADLEAVPPNTMLYTPKPFEFPLHSNEDSCFSFMFQFIPLFLRVYHTQPLKDQWSSNSMPKRTKLNRGTLQKTEKSNTLHLAVS